MITKYLLGYFIPSKSHCYKLGNTQFNLIQYIILQFFIHIGLRLKATNRNECFVVLFVSFPFNHIRSDMLMTFVETPVVCYFLLHFANQLPSFCKFQLSLDFLRFLRLLHTFDLDLHRHTYSSVHTLCT